MQSCCSGCRGVVGDCLRYLVNGIENADSWATDGHKWLNVAFDCGYAFVADAEAHRASLMHRAAYLSNDASSRDPVGLESGMVAAGAWLSHLRGAASTRAEVAAAVCLCIADWQASSFVVSLKLRQRLKRAHEDSKSVAKMEVRQSGPALQQADMDAFVNASSITEHTTSLLERAQLQESRYTLTGSCRKTHQFRLKPSGN